MELIDKSALVAEIEKRINDWTIRGKNSLIGQGKDTCESRVTELNDLLSFLDTLEVKEVDLDESARYYLLHEHISPLNEVLHQADLKVEMQYHKDIEDAYKAGFELGIKARKGE